MSAPTVDRIDADQDTDRTDDHWTAQSACAVDNWPKYMGQAAHEPEVFYPRRLEGGQCAPAKSLCQQCPVRAECLEAGLKEPCGVWGGLSEKERRVAQKMTKKGKTIAEILAHFDSLVPKRRRKADLPSRETEAADLTRTVIEGFVEHVGAVPTGAFDSGSAFSDLPLGGSAAAPSGDPTRLTVEHFRAATTAVLQASPEVLREERRRRNGLR